MITLFNAEKAFDNIQHVFMIQEHSTNEELKDTISTFKKLYIKYLLLTSHLMVKDSKDFLLKSGTS